MNDAYMKLNAINVLYGLAGGFLVRLTVESRNDQLSIQVLYQAGASEDEVQRYRCFSSELLAALGSAQLNEDLIQIRSLAEAQSTRPLPVHIYCVYGAEFRSA
jgi:hypothetical protein